MAEDTTPPLDKARKKSIQEVCGVFLFLARGVNGGLLPALSALASQQANPTERMLALCKQFLDYMASQDKAVLTYKARDMVLAIHSNTSYLSEPKACSRVGGHMFMAGRDDIPSNNGAVLKFSTFCKKYGMSCHPPWRQNLAPSSSMQKTPSPCATRSKNLATPSHQHQCKQTTKPHMTYSPTKLCQRH